MGSYSLGLEAAKILGFLGFLFVLAILAVRARNRIWNPRGRGPYLALVEALNLGGNRLICLVRVGKSFLILGVTDKSVSLLKETKEDEMFLRGDTEKGPEEPSKPNDDGHNFARYLSAVLKRHLKKGRGIGTVAAILALAACLLAPAKTLAAPADLPLPDVSIRIGGMEGRGGLLTALGILGVLTVLALAPAILILTTSFTRIVVVFSFLRAGLGTQQTPPNQVLIGLALLLTFFVMSPTWGQVNQVAIQPYVAGEIDAQEAFARGQVPIRDFMLRHTREKDLGLFVSLTQEENPRSPEDLSLVQVVPAFAISELRTAFEIGFVLFLPFLVIDMVVASTLMSMGMLMLPPVLISLPFKVLLFVLVDGWALVVRSLIGSFR